MMVAICIRLCPSGVILGSKLDFRAIAVLRNFLRFLIDSGIEQHLVSAPGAD